MKNKFLKLFLPLLFISVSIKAQLEKVMVETYYVSDSLDATDTIGGGLEAGSTTYRVYVDLAPGSRLHAVYADANHSLKLRSTENFFNNKVDGQTFGKDFPKNRLQENTVALDTWLTLGQTTKYSAAKTYFGVSKANDNDGSFIGGQNNDGGSAAITYGLLSNTNSLAGIALTTSDGMDTMTATPTNWIDNGILNSAGDDSTIFGSLATGNQFVSNNAYLQNSGVTGVIPDSNQILIAQLTTKGQLSFELNIKVLTSTGDTLFYVASDSINLLPNEILNSYLKYPYVQSCGCPDPRYLEYSSFRDCDNQDSCKTVIVFGCMDINACNYDVEANFNLSELCCYPGSCNDRDLAVVCPSLISGNREFAAYPNPVQHILNLKISGGDKDASNYEIYNSFGRIVAQSKTKDVVGTDVQQVDVSNLETGLYLIRVYFNSDSESKIFMKN